MTNPSMNMPLSQFPSISISISPPYQVIKQRMEFYPQELPICVHKLDKEKIRSTIVYIIFHREDCILKLTIIGLDLKKRDLKSVNLWEINICEGKIIPKEFDIQAIQNYIKQLKLLEYIQI